ncbi:MAG: EamA family transporter [Ardenticatenaceae bacterium]|nr:EamA family transporter [Ardenticatenaceae bacterium]
MDVGSWVVLGLLGLVWGSSYLFIKIGVGEVPPAWVVAGRLLAGTLFLSAILRWRKESLPPRRLWPALAATTFFNSAFPFLLIAWGEQWVSSGLASILNATTPLFSVVIASSAGDEHLSWQKVAGIVIGFVGVIVLIGASLREVTQSTLGELAIVAASACYAVGALFARRWLKGSRPVPLATGQMMLGFLMVVPLVFLPANRLVVTPSAVAVASIAALGLLGSGLAYVLYYRLISTVGATRTLLVTYIIPVTAILWGWLLLDETLSLRTFLGLGLIISGILLVNREHPAGRAPVAVKRVVAD